MQRLTTGLFCVLLVGSTADRPAEAGVIPDIYNFIFAPSVPYYQTSLYRPGFATYGYGTSYRYGVGYGGFYGGPRACCRPIYRPAPVRTYYAPPVNCCDPCRVSCDPCNDCPGGNCALPPRTYDGGDNWSPTPADGAPRTYRDEPTDSAPPADLREPAPPEGDGPLPGGRDAGPGAFEPPAGGGLGEERESLRPPSEVPQRDDAVEGAPITEPEAGEAGPPAEDEAGAPPATDGTDFLLPPLQLDEKVTWRVRPVRKRLTIRSRFPTPSVARTRVNPNEDWVPVASETKIVSK